MIENLEEIKSHANIDLIISVLGLTGIQGNGKEIRANCPIIDHNKSKQSFSIDQTTGQWFCHACAEGGDIIELVEQTKNISFFEAVNFIAECSGREINTFRAATKESWPKIVKEGIDIEKLNHRIELILEKASPSGNHVYLDNKRVEACPGLYFGNYMDKPSIIVPLCNVDGLKLSVQYIHENGDKPYLSKSVTTGAFFTIGTFKDNDKIYLAEGLATALTIWMALDKSAPVISFGSANNICHVADALKLKYPNLKLIFCLDNSDAAFKQVAKLNPAHNAHFRLPSFEGLKSQNSDKKLSDFNDLISKCGQEIEIVREQLMIEKTINDLPIVTKRELMAEVAPRADRMPSSFNHEYQEDILNYLMKQPLDNIINDGFDPVENFKASIFTGDYCTVMDGIIKTWEQGLDISIAQISINSGNNTPRFYALLNQIEKRSLIKSNQVAERIRLVSHYRSQNEFNDLLAKIQKSEGSLHEKASILRNGIDAIQGNSEIVLPQSYYLPQLIADIKKLKDKVIATGITSLDRLIGGGFIKGEFGILAGGAGAGKTAFALQIADSVAALNSIVIYISVEIGISKLTQRSFKRLSYQPNAKDVLEGFDYAISKYQQFANNIYMQKGRHGMQVFEIRGIVLSVMRQNKGKDVLLIIDPFQRLGTGNEKVDGTNETIKVTTLSSQIKEMSEQLNIPILALSDTTKSYKENRTGEGSIRGSYMANHIGDWVMMIRTSRDPLKALYDIDISAKDEENPFLEKVKTELQRAAFKERYKLVSNWDKYASLVTSKVRDSGVFNPLFVYKPAFHLFEDTLIWKNILQEDKN